jgi:hypothetical protein
MHGKIPAAWLYLSLVALVYKANTVSAFIQAPARYGTFEVSVRTNTRSGVKLLARTSDEEEMERLQEESRMKVLTSRRNTIRSTLKSAESLKNFRLENGM